MALEVRDQIAAFGRPVRFSELQGGSAYPKATLCRLVQTLSHHGKPACNPDRQTWAQVCGVSYFPNPHGWADCPSYLLP